MSVSDSDTSPTSSPTEYLHSPPRQPHPFPNQMMATVKKLGGPILETKGPNKKIVPRGLPSVVVDADLIRQMKDQSLYFDGHPQVPSLDLDSIDTEDVRQGRSKGETM